jgi:hypothetical protein
VRALRPRDTCIGDSSDACVGAAGPGCWRFQGLSPVTTDSSLGAVLRAELATTTAYGFLLEQWGSIRLGRGLRDRGSPGLTFC